MTHLSDDELVLLHYGEDAEGDARAHAVACPECAGRLRLLGETLEHVAVPDPPEPEAGFEARLWSRLAPVLASHAQPLPSQVLPLRPKHGWGRRGAAWAALAASLVAAFLLGRHLPRPGESITAEARERILLVAVGDHLERSQMVLVELVNAGGNGSVDVSSERAWADELVSANRIYRQTAVRAGETALAGVLEELERVLAEVAASPDTLSSDDFKDLRQRIESRGILFKVRVIETQVRAREKDAAPASGSVS